MKATIENIRIAEQDRSYNSYVLAQKAGQNFPSIFNDYWHYHPEIEITYIVKGKGLAFIGNKTIEFEPGQAFLLGPYLPHNFVSTEEEDVQMEKECWGAPIHPGMAQQLQRERLSSAPVPRHELRH